MEGDPFFDPAGGLEFLFGVLWREADGTTTYRPFWAHDRDGERRAFEEFVDFVGERRARVSRTCTSTTTPPTSPRRSRG